MKLMNKIAVVTGGASGMGEAICRLFAKEGAKVVVADYNFEGAEKVASEISRIDSTFGSFRTSKPEASCTQAS